MNVAVRYYTKSGNTKKVAEAVAKTAGVSAETVEKPITEETDVLFLGSSVYAAGVDGAVKEFIGKLDPAKVKCVVNFSTAALLPSTYKQVKELVEKRGIQMAEKEFHCRGKFAMMHKNKPDQNDLAAAEAFTKEILADKA